MSRPLLCVFVAASVLAVPLAGCRKGNAIALVKVGGTVTLDGTPLTKGAIQFTPDNSKGTRGPMATGAIGPDGKFALTTTNPGDGAQAGFYKVAVSCWEVVPFDPKNPKPSPPPKSLIPERYADDKTSGLTAEVKSGTANELTFDLKSPGGGATPSP
jgi:hypothetical protein